METQPPMQRHRWPAVVVAVAGVAVIAFSGYLLATWPPEPPESDVTVPAGSRTQGPAETDPSSTAATGLAVVVLGDEYSAQ